MKIIAVVGSSGSGKTRLIARLIPELKKRGLTVAGVKHCSHGYDLGGDHKDSSMYLLAGADAVALCGPGRTAVLREKYCESRPSAVAREEFGRADIVLIEGGRGDPGLQKIEVLREGHSDGLRTPPDELCAVVADYPVSCGRPIFHPDQATEIADWLAARLGLESRSDERSFADRFFMKRDAEALAALRKSTVGIAGVGGLGSNAAAALARAAIGRLIIADFDYVEASDLSRQFYFVDQVGMPKVEALQENLKRLNPLSTYEIHNVKVDRENAATVFASADILVEAFDLAVQKQMLIEAWLSRFPERPIIIASGLAGYGNNDQLHERRLGNLYICGDETSECGPASPPMAPRVAIVANMQANLVVELLVSASRKSTPHPLPSVG